MLIHICCSVDSHYFIERIKEDYPDEKLVGYFYDPNIHPYSEYRLRYLDVEYSCKKLGIELIEGEYNLEDWLNSVKGLEHLPEKQERCTVCFDFRLENSIKKALELGHNSFTTTLLMSPRKSQEKIYEIARKFEKETNISFIYKDYKSGIGMESQIRTTKKNSLYRQDYCGCLFALKLQRDNQKKIMDEMFNPISKQILPNSIEQRYELYKKRDRYEETNQDYKIVKKRFLNYRLLSGKVVLKKEIIPSYIFIYSKMAKRQTIGRVEYNKGDIYYFNRDEVKFITLSSLNNFLNKEYKSVKELIYNPLKIEDEIELRFKILKNYYDLSALIVLDKIEDEKYSIYIDSVVYEDIKEEII